MSFEISDLSVDKIVGLTRESTVIFLTLGPIEDHGPHLPVGLDGIEARSLAKKVAEKIESTLPGWTVLHYPLSAMGIETDSSNFAVRVRAHVLRDYLVDVCESFYRSGFKHFVCFSGHTGPKQLTAIEEAGKIFRNRHKGWFFFKNKKTPSLVSANSVLLDSAESSSSPLWMNPPEHGGIRDTSVALSVCPALVDEKFKALPEQPRVGNAFQRFIQFRKNKITGYWGNPKEASAEQGSKILNEKIETLVPKLRAVWDGSNPTHVFKSWFSIYPTNKSLFRIWILVVALILILGVWMSLAFHSMMTGAEY